METTVKFQDLAPSEELELTQRLNTANAKDKRRYDIVLKQACENTETEPSLELSYCKRNDEKSKNMIVCKGFLNDVYITEASHVVKGRKARIECARKIIELILYEKVLVEKIVLENLSAVMGARKRLAKRMQSKPLHQPGGVNMAGEKAQKAITACQPKPANLQSKDNNATKKDESIQGTVSTGQYQKPQPLATKNSQTVAKICRQGIKEPTVVNQVNECNGIGLPYQPTTSKNKLKKPRVQPIITHKFIQKFKSSNTHEIVITEPLIKEDHRLLQKLCVEKRGLSYEFVPPLHHLVIRKSENWEQWEATKTGQKRRKEKQTQSASFLEGIENIPITESLITNPMSSMTDKLSSNVIIKQPLEPTATEQNNTTHRTIAMTTASAMDYPHLPTMREIVKPSTNVIIKQEPLEPTPTQHVTTTRYPMTIAMTTASAMDFDPVVPHLPTMKEMVDPSSNVIIKQETTTSMTENAITDGHSNDKGIAIGNVFTLNNNGGDQHLNIKRETIDNESFNLYSCSPPTLEHTITPPTEAELLYTLNDFGLGDDIGEIFLNFVKSSETELEITRHMTSEERLILYKISDAYSFHFMLFSHDNHDRSIVIRKSQTYNS